MTTPNRPLPQGVEIREFENGWHAYRLPTEDRPWPEVLLHPCQGDHFSCEVEYWTKHQVRYRSTESDAIAAFWAWFDLQPENQAKAETKYDSPGYRAGYAAGLESAERVISELTARVAALEANGSTEPNNDPDMIKALMEERERLWDVISWALGENGEFPERQPGDGAYWWRKEMRRRLGSIRPAPAPPPAPPEPVVGMVYMNPKAKNDPTRAKWCGNGLAASSPGNDVWHKPDSVFGAIVATMIRSGLLIPVPGYRVEAP